MISAYVLIAAKVGRVEEVLSKLSKIKNINKIEKVQGEYDIIAEVITKDDYRLENIIHKNIKKLKSIGLVSTLILKK